MIDLPPYSGNEVQCPKCGWKGISPSSYRRPGRCDGDQHEPPPYSENLAPAYSLSSLTRTSLSLPERLCRACGSCGYGWDQSCVPPGVPERTDIQETE